MKRYREAGVDLSKARAVVDIVKAVAGGQIGDFSGAFPLKGLTEEFERPVLLCSTDSVGTKVELAREAGLYGGLGQDLVGMVVNDLACRGAKPLFFLDYYASASIDLKTFREVVQSVHAACVSSGCLLLGGETAELPGVYPQEGQFDLVGFGVGVVEEEWLRRRPEPGDIIVAFPSSGFHSNGYSLIRKLLKEMEFGHPGERRDWVERLLAPTRLYVEVAHRAFKERGAKAGAHITGGGLVENLSRAVPGGLTARIDTALLPNSETVDEFLALTGMPREEAGEVFNMGTGFLLVVPAGETAWGEHCGVVAGEMVEGEERVELQNV